MRSREIRLAIAKYVPRLIATSYALYVLGYAVLMRKLPPLTTVCVWLLVIGIAYGLKDYYLEGEEALSEEELEEYPSWIRNHAIWGLDGVRIKRRILMESK